MLREDNLSLDSNNRCVLFNSPEGLRLTTLTSGVLEWRVKTFAAAAITAFNVDLVRYGLSTRKQTSVWEKNTNGKKSHSIHRRDNACLVHFLCDFLPELHGLFDPK